jgi:hypothetical protein
VLYRFHGKDGATPAAGVILEGDRNLYGPALAGGNSGYGVIFKLQKPVGRAQSWSESVLHRFRNGNDGADPEGNLVFDAGGNLYGTTNSGGTLSGTVFRLKPPTQKNGCWNLSTVHGFTSIPDGENPTAGVILDRTGNLYGTTQYGGQGSGCGFSGCGTVFEVSP